ncbi:ATP-dependent Clp protease ATP-binding subunit [Companilactobacillus zhachilii]|uniref:ATP-dependent Clp protease ATP-binding subunit n=1 Tax=Companilactobacillus zhachilii TaxID=2304606 RepID=A0A386PT14_9LACO|nr:ATP-dependent Clp protease ATP-binding subunit [Companilactobacillus zhachilii]AYE37547.1 ATP-dependent Clp protease ATP-binding subunit [Companilactobacillus zhachilii]
MDKVFTESAKNALVLAQEQAKTFHHNAVGTEHILLGLVMENDGIAGITLRDLAVSDQDVEEEIEHLTGYGDVSSNTAKGIYLPYSPKGQLILSDAEETSNLYKATRIGTEHILLAILDDTDNLANRILVNLGLSLAKTKSLLLSKMGISNKTARRGFAANMAAKQKKQQAQGNGGTPTLDSLARDLTKMAQDNQIDPVIGRKSEVERTIQILSRRTKNNPVLVGEPGVGKTAIAEGLAIAIVKKEVPLDMQNKRIMMLDMGSLVAGTKYRGEFEDRLKKVIEEIYQDKHVILFIDELHTLIGAGGAEGAIDASNILKPALARGELQLIGATTSNEYQKYIEKDTALERRFAKVHVEEPSAEDSIKILEGLRPRYEQHHGLTISDEAVEAAVRFSTRYLTNRFLPDKAIDLMDEASAKVRIHNVSKNNKVEELTDKSMKLLSDKNNAILDQDFEKAAQIREQEQDVQEELSKLKDKKVSSKKPVVTADDIAEVIAQWTGVPVKQITRKESEKLLNLEKELHKRVIGQEDAINAVSRAIRRARSGMKDPNRPIGSFMFLGPTGVGKTELAKSIAEVMFGSEDNMIRVDMSEYMEQYSTSKLIGSAPGYVGFDDGGQLTEKVRNEPYSVVLLDEVEKAHPDVFNILLQVLDDGILTDAKGRKVDFRNTIIIMTSNLGARALEEDKSVGFGARDVHDDYKEMQERINVELKKFFRPEFLNRVDETIVFKSLNKEQLKAIAKIMSNNLRKRLAEREIKLVISPTAYNDLVKDGYNPEYGARPMRRTIQREIEDPVSEQLLMGNVKAGDSIKVGSKKGKLTVTVDKPEVKKTLTHQK